jgi:hypothetical protein
MQLNAEAFARHLDGFAEQFKYRKAYACPCLNPTSSAPQANCPACLGKGWLWSLPIDADCAVASSKVQLEWSKMGNWESGDLVLSIPYTSVLYGIAQFDRVVQLTSTDERALVLVRGSERERLQGAVKQVLRTFWFADDGQTPVEGGIPTVGGDGRLAWPATGAPPAGKKYSITYCRYTEYYCFGEFSNDRKKHGGALLPRRVVLRRFDLLGRTPTPVNA